jgi:acyl carrier protein
LGKDTIYEAVKGLLISEFKVDAEKIELNKCLDEDLDLDSLDMVDLIIALNDYIGDKIDLSLFKEARTLQDVVNLLEPLWKAA